MRGFEFAFALALSAAAAGCATGARGPRPPPKVDHLGSMQEMFERKSAAGRVALEPLLGLKHLYALGPLEGLRGELLIWDCTPFTSRMVDGVARVVVERDLRAPFLVWSSVKAWRDVDVPDDARTLAQFEKWLPGAARKAGLDSSKPFAFQVLGAVEHAAIHVVDLSPDEVLTREAHAAAKRVVTLDAVPAQMLGFYAPDDAGAKGVWLHHSANVHLHLRNQLGTVMGHVDDFTLAEGATVKIAWE